jgi:hypothetical protein
MLDGAEGSGGEVKVGLDEGFGFEAFGADEGGERGGTGAFFDGGAEIGRASCRERV